MRNKMLKTTIKNIELEYSVDYRNVKYIRYEIIRGKLKLILPKRFNGNIEYYIHKKENWIYNKVMEFNQHHLELKKATKDKNIINRSLKDLKIISNNYISKYQNLLNVKVNRLQFRTMTTKWGSCSSLSNITLSKDLRFLPEELIAYVIYHELAHLIILDHSDKFFKIIKKEFPDYESYDSKLSEYWFLINNRN